MSRKQALLYRLDAGAGPRGDYMCSICGWTRHNVNRSTAHRHVKKEHAEYVYAGVRTQRAHTNLSHGKRHHVCMESEGLKHEWKHIRA